MSFSIDWISTTKKSLIKEIINMKRFFTFSGTISGSTFILRSLFTIVLSIPFIVIVFAMLGTIVFSYMDIDLAAADGMSMEESNAIGEDAGLKIAEEMTEIGPMAWFSQNISAFWIVSTILSLIPVIWFGLATYYKRVSTLFYSNRVKAFLAFIVAKVVANPFTLTYLLILSTMGILGFIDVQPAYHYLTITSITIYSYLSFKYSSFDDHDG